jgi:hypothetical protein
MGDTSEDGILAGCEVCLAGFVREQYLGTLTGPMQEMQGRNVQGTRAMVVLHRMLRRDEGETRRTVLAMKIRLCTLINAQGDFQLAQPCIAHRRSAHIFVSGR